MEGEEDSRAKRAEQQRLRRMARRDCGNCGAAAETSVDWKSGQSIAICLRCEAALDRVRGEAMVVAELSEVRPCEELRLILLEGDVVVPAGPIEVFRRGGGEIVGVRRLGFLGWLGRLLRRH